MRRGEILSLTWDGYDKQTATIRLAGRSSKNGRPRAIPLGSWPELAALVTAVGGRMPGSALIFHNGRGQRVGDFYTTWMRAAERAKVSTGLTFHDLRRTAVGNMVAVGIARATATAISGHETDSIFERYQIIEKNISDALAKRAAYELGITGGSK